jgi:HAD superfamily hydrolase (TIGR01490 family)
MKSKSEVAVVFDLDKTITSNDTYLFFLLTFLRYNPFRLLRCWLLPFAFISFKVKLRDNTWLKKKFLGAIVGGTTNTKINAFVKPFVKTIVEQKLRKNALQEILLHKESGHILILATASFDFYVEELGHQLGFDAIICTNSVWDNNQLQADISGDNCYGISKLNKVTHFVETNENISYTIAYTDHHSDLPLMDWVDEAIAVNPTNKLRELATQKGYEIKSW